jgi:lipid II:glycine glycyltransferase (peptidoglycan interpeptide bridge formation enzyme)
MSMQPLIDETSEAEWSDLLPTFDDATLYQTWSYGAVRWGERNCSRLVLRQDETAVAMALSTVRRLPLAGVGMAYVFWGPLWRRRGEAADPRRWRAALRALKDEYCTKRKLMLRLVPAEIDADNGEVKSILESEGFVKTPRKEYTTIIMDLSPDLDTIRKNFDQKWRNQLNKAEKSGLQTREGDDEEMFDVFLSLSQEMIRRKRFRPGVDYLQFKSMQRTLPAGQKMRIMQCASDTKPVASVICSSIAGRGIYLLGASGDAGKNLNGSNLLHWKMIQQLKSDGCRLYDLGGVNPERNPGVYKFKQGLAGKNGAVRSHIGEYQYCANPFSRHFIEASENVRRLMRRLKGRL